MEVLKQEQLLVKGANTKSEIEFLAEALIVNLQEKGNVLEMVETIAATEHLVKLIKADPRFTEYVQETLSQYSGKASTNSGAKVETMEGGTKYHFDKCGDEQLNLLEIELESKAEQVKSRKEFLKTIPKEGLEILTKEGEVLTIYPPYKTSVSTYKVSLAK